MTRHDAVIIGAGFAGLYQLHKLRDEQGLDVRIIERGSGVGGTWFWNRYPGARCDVESRFYSYSFDDELQDDWHWSERYASQPEILAYIEHVADRFDLLKDVRLNTAVEAVDYDERAGLWRVTLDSGEHVDATYVIAAVGSLSTTLVPPIDGIENFAGEVHHTGAWPRDPVDFAGKRVGVIGTGSSGIQVVASIAAACAKLVVFQRTPNYVVPAANRRISAEEDKATKAEYSALRQRARESKGGMVLTESGQKISETPPSERTLIFDRAWTLGGFNFTNAFTDTAVSQESNDVAAEYFRERLAGLVTDLEVREKLTPSGYPLGTKRLCVADGYYEAFNRDNVELVDLRSAPIEGVSPGGIRVGGVDHDLDMLIFATGYDAITGSLLRLNITGRSGRPLRDEWAAGPRTYLGVASHGFPNLFFVTGPGSPSVISNVVQSIEQHVDWISELIAHASAVGVSSVEVEQEAQDAWVDRVNAIANMTLYPKAASWYMGANVPGKPRVFMPYLGGVGRFRDECDAIRDDGYPGFSLGGHRVQVA